MPRKNEKVLNFVQKRNDNIESKRRDFERLMFQHVLGVYAAVDTTAGSITPIELVDISRQGCLIQVPVAGNEESVVKNFKRGQEMTLRMYFTDNSYIPVVASVKHGQDHADHEGRKFKRFGLEFDQSMASFEALQSFIEFLYKFAELSVVDRGDRRVYFL